MPIENLTWNTQGDVIGAKQRILDHYLPVDYRRHLREKIRSTKQQKNENVASFIASLRYLISLYNHEMAEDDVVDMIIEGMRPEIAKEVLIVNPRTINELTERANLIEGIISRLNERVNVRALITMQRIGERDLEAEIDELNRQLDELMDLGCEYLTE